MLVSVHISLLLLRAPCVFHWRRSAAHIGSATQLTSCREAAGGIWNPDLGIEATLQQVFTDPSALSFARAVLCPSTIEISSCETPYDQKKGYIWCFRGPGSRYVEESGSTSLDPAHLGERDFPQACSFGGGSSCPRSLLLQIPSRLP